MAVEFLAESKKNREKSWKEGIRTHGFLFPSGGQAKQGIRHGISTLEAEEISKV